MTEVLDRLFAAHLAEMTARADRALAATGCDALVIGAGLPRLQFLDDRPYTFRANPHFSQWVPLADAPGSLVIYVPGRRPQFIFHQPEDYWHTPPEMPTAAWIDHFEVSVVRSADGAREFVPQASAYIGEPFPAAADWGCGAVNPPRLLDQLHYDRARKTPYEVECLRRASMLGARAHRAAERAFRAGAAEFEIHLAYLAACGLREEELPYGNIIAQNRGAATLHYTTLSRIRPAERHSLLIDAGAQFRSYACDITRTYAAGDGPFAALVAALESAQLELCGLVRPGTEYVAIHLAAHLRIARILREQGVIRCTAETAVESGLSSVFFPHGIGHLLGLQVHDIGGFQADRDGRSIAPPPGHPYLRLTRRVEPGFVVTIEPGIYFIDLLLAAARSDARGRDIDWDRVAALHPAGGARIEDDVIATHDDPENLTRRAFAALQH
jgi:Xaa-Pro dipeptidase